MNLWKIYERAPPDRSTVSSIRVIEAKDKKGEIMTHVGCSIRDLSDKCGDDKRFWEVDKDVWYTTVPAAMVSRETGDKITNVTTYDLTRFRIGYEERKLKKQKEEKEKEEREKAEKENP